MGVKLFDGSRGPRGSIEYSDFPLLGEIDRTVELHTVLDVDGALFAAGVVDKSAAKVYPLAYLRSGATGLRRRLFPVCPYCSSPVSCDGDIAEDVTLIDCDTCGGTFMCERIVDVTYDTTPIHAPKKIKAHWVKIGDGAEKTN